MLFNFLPVTHELIGTIMFLLIIIVLNSHVFVVVLLPTLRFPSPLSWALPFPAKRPCTSVTTPSVTFFVRDRSRALSPSPPSGRSTFTNQYALLLHFPYLKSHNLPRTPLSPLPSPLSLPIHHTPITILFSAISVASRHERALSLARKWTNPCSNMTRRSGHCRS